MTATTYKAKFKATTVTIADGNSDGVFQSDQDNIEIKTTLAAGSKTADPEVEAGYNPAWQLDLIMKSDPTRLNGLKIRTLNEFILDMNRAAVAAEACDSTTALKYVEEAREDAREGKFIGLFGPTLPKMEAHIATLQAAAGCQPGAVATTAPSSPTASTTKPEFYSEVIDNPQKTGDYRILAKYAVLFKDNTKHSEFDLRIVNDNGNSTIDGNESIMLVSNDPRMYPANIGLDLSRPNGFFPYYPLMAIATDTVYVPGTPYKMAGKSIDKIILYLRDAKTMMDSIVTTGKVTKEIYDKSLAGATALGIKDSENTKTMFAQLKKYIGVPPATPTTTTATVTSTHPETTAKGRSFFTHTLKGDPGKPDTLLTLILNGDNGNNVIDGTERLVVSSSETGICTTCFLTDYVHPSSTVYYYPAMFIESVSKNNPYPLTGKTLDQVRQYLASTGDATFQIMHGQKISQTLYDQVKKDVTALGLDRANVHGVALMLDWMKKNIGASSATITDLDAARRAAMVTQNPRL